MKASPTVKQAQPANAAAARKLERFCTALMKKGRRADAKKWIQSKNHTLGEMTWSESRRLIEKLLERGATSIFACDIDSYDDDTENTGHLVVTLPVRPAARAALIEELDRLAHIQGCDSDPDNGQTSAYVKLD